MTRAIAVLCAAFLWGGLAQAQEATPEGGVDLSARIPTRADAPRFYHLLGAYELHFNLISDDQSANDVYSWYMAQARFDLSKHDQVGLRIDALQKYVADPGENGWWLGDLRFQYWRKFAIPIPGFAIPGTASFYLTAPTSRESRARSYQTRPTVLVSLAPAWGPLSLIATGTYRYTFAKYAESGERSVPNERQTASVQAQLQYQPFDWFSPSFLWQSFWSESYPARNGSGQGWRGSYYYFEFAANFSMPMPKGSPTLDLSLAYGQGAPPLTDGLYRFAFAKRDQAEVYLGVNVGY